MYHKKHSLVAGDAICDYYHSMTFQIESNVPIDKQRKPRINPWGLYGRLRATIEQCKPGESFVVDTLKEAQNASAIAKKMKRNACYRKMPDSNSRRVWLLD